MRLKKILLFFTLAVIINFTALGQNVSFNEMRIKPSVRIAGDLLFVYTSNSTQNSGLFIYQIILGVDQKTKSVFISANQALGKPYKTQFLINSKAYNINEPGSYKYYWIDPDKRRTQLEIISEGEAGKYDN